MLLLVYLLVIILAVFKEGHGNKTVKLVNRTLIICHDPLKTSQVRNYSTVMTHKTSVTYDSSELKSIRDSMKNTYKSTCLSYNTIGNVRKYGINKNKRKRKHKQNEEQSRQIKFSNLQSK